MLGKLLKYDFKATGKLFGILSVIVLCTTAVGCGALTMMISYDGFSANNPVELIFSISISMLFFFSVLAIFAYALAVMVLVIHRFYNSMFTDQGYLTFTLPVSSHTLLLSKTISSAVTMLGSVIVAVLCIVGFVMTSIYAVSDANLPQLIWEAFREWLNIFGINVIATTSTAIVLLIVRQISAILTIFLAFTIGAVVVKKHKVLAGIGFYFAISCGKSIIQSIVSVEIMYFSDAENSLISSSGNWLMFDQWMQILFSAALAVAAYFITHHLIKNKLNLS